MTLGYVCPKCGSEDTYIYDSWEMTGRGDITTKINLVKCKACKKRFRKGEKIGI